MRDLACTRMHARARDTGGGYDSTHAKWWISRRAERARASIAPGAGDARRHDDAREKHALTCTVTELCVHRARPRARRSRAEARLRSFREPGFRVAAPSRFELPLPP